MLVLSRKQGERIHIGQAIIVTVLRSSGSRVTLGITAPTAIPVERAELKPRGGEDGRSEFHNLEEEHMAQPKRLRMGIESPAVSMHMGCETGRPSRTLNSLEIRRRLQ